MGRNKKPTKTKIIQGTFRKDRANPNEPMPDVNIPDPPEHLSPIAQEEWNRISIELYRNGLVTSIDMAALAGYCQSYGRWVDAEIKLSETGLLTKTTNGNIIQNPLVGIANKALEHMRKFLIEFGMSPSSRAKVTTTPKGKEKKGFAALNG